MNACKWMLPMLVLALPVLAADDMAAKLANISEAQRDKVAAILENQQKRLGMCNRVEIVQPTQVVAPGDVTFNPDGSARDGLWMVRYAVKACNIPALRMVAFEARDGKVALNALAPGATLADAGLQKDVMHSFALVASKLNPSCGQLPVVRNTQVIYPPDAKTGAWREAWVAAACGHEIGQMIDFVPTKQGTQFRMALPKK